LQTVENATELADVAAMFAEAQARSNRQIQSSPISIALAYCAATKFEFVLNLLPRQRMKLTWALSHCVNLWWRSAVLGLQPPRPPQAAATVFPDSLSAISVTILAHP
jgi:hypothetical protein